MIILFSKSIKNMMGGVEVFNHELELCLKANNYSVITWDYRYGIILNNLIDTFIRAVSLLFSSKKNKIIIVQHSGLRDILILPILYYSSKELYVIHHAGSEWKHLKNKIVASIVRIILNKYVKKKLFIAEFQKNLIGGKNAFKIHTIVNKEFLYKTTSNTRGNYILYLGRVAEEKGCTDLVQAYCLNYKKTKQELKLYLVGPIHNTYRSKLQRIISNQGLEHEILLMPPVYEVQKKIELIDNCCFGIYPSYKDTFPLTVIEFYLRKKICVASAIAETKNFIDDSEYLVNPGDIEGIAQKIMVYGNQQWNDYSVDKLFIKAMKYAGDGIINDLKTLNVI